MLTNLCDNRVSLPKLATSLHKVNFKSPPLNRFLEKLLKRCINKGIDWVKLQQFKNESHKLLLCDSISIHFRAVNSVFDSCLMLGCLLKHLDQGTDIVLTQC